MANRKISQLTALTTPAAGDYLPIVDISEAAAADQNKRITIEELLRGAPDGTAAAPSIAFESDPNTGIYSAGADQLGFATAGTGRLFIDANGGTRIEAATIPLIASRTISGSSLGGLILRQSDTTNGNGLMIVYQSDTTGTGAASNVDFAAIQLSADVHDQATRAGSIRFLTSQGGVGNNQERLRITSAGKVGIGTSSPQTPLDVVSSSDASITLTRTAAANAKITTTSNGALAFGLDTSGGNTERLRIDSAGKVGIGTSSPGALLHLSSSAPAVRISETDQAVDKKNWDITSLAGNLEFRSLNDAGSAANRFISVGRGSTYDISSLKFFTGSDQERLRIDSAGKVGIGTSSPFATLHALGGSTVAILQRTGANACQINVGDSNLSNIYYDADAHIYRSGAGTEAARIDSSGRLLVGTTSTTGSTSNSAPVVAGLFRSFNGAVSSTASATAYTAFTAPNANATYIVIARINSVQDAANYEEVALLSSNAGASVSLSLTTLKDGGLMAISLSGADVQVAQSSGSNQDIAWTATRVG